MTFFCLDIIRLLKAWIRSMVEMFLLDSNCDI
jgi:hypothetical protein